MCERFSREMLLSGGCEAEAGQVAEDLSLEARGNGVSWSKRHAGSAPGTSIRGLRGQLKLEGTDR